MKLRVVTLATIGGVALIFWLFARVAVARLGVVDLPLALGGGALVIALAALPRWVFERRLRAFAAQLDAARRGANPQPLLVRGRDGWAQLAASFNGALGALQSAERRHRRGEALQRQMAQIALGEGDAFWVWEAGSAFLQWHGDVDRLLGYGAGGMERTLAAWLDHVYSADHGKVARVCARVPAPGETLELDFRVIRRDGTTRVWRLRGRALHNDDGTPRLLAICQDITERRRDEEELRSSRERLQRIFETAADAILITDAHGQITFANAAAEITCGLMRDEIGVLSIYDARWNLADASGQPYGAHEHPFSRVRASGKTLNECEFSFDRPDGSRIVASLNAAPLLDERGLFSGIVASVTDVTERRAMQDKLYYQAFHDPLTHLANRALVRHRLDHALQQRDLGENEIAIIFIDLDNFKYINDSLGHAAGDELLVAIADRLRASLRAGDTAARMGGDEFVILLEGVDMPCYAVMIAQRVLESLREPFAIGKREVYSTPSIGIAFSGARTAENAIAPDELLRHADAAMYEAKRRGKACFAVYEASMSADALRRLELENDLRRALQKGEFSLRYQPKWDFAREQVSGFEALVRWNHPTRGMISPGEFIPLAEETGLIIPMGFQILTAACHQAQAWNGAGERDWIMSVNISARQLYLPEMVPLVAQALQESGLKPERLILEITESAIVERTQQMLQTLGALKELGVKLAIDDFGTGYSSLAYLRSFPFDYLKIDRQFVAGVHQDRGNGAIITSMVTLAHALDLTVIAEGAELEAEVAQLRELGCDMAQGYYFGYPETAECIEQTFGLGTGARQAMVLPVEAVEVTPMTALAGR